MKKICLNLILLILSGIGEGFCIHEMMNGTSKLVTFCAFVFAISMIVAVTEQIFDCKTLYRNLNAATRRAINEREKYLQVLRDKDR